MQESLGCFGDVRLEKGGPICWLDLYRMVARAFGSGGWAGTERARCGSRGFCGTLR